MCGLGGFAFVGGFLGEGFFICLFLFVEGFGVFFVAVVVVWVLFLFIFSF